MGFNSAFKGLKLLKKNPGNGRLNNLNDPVLNVLIHGRCPLPQTHTASSNWMTRDNGLESRGNETVVAELKELR